MLSFYFKKNILAVCFILLLVSSYCYASGQGDVADAPKPATVMFFNQGYNDFKQGRPVVFIRDQGDGKYLTNLGPVDSSLLETTAEKEQRQQSVAEAVGHSGQASDEYNLVLNNADGCTIEFSPPHEHLIYADNMSLKEGVYDIHVSKHLYISFTLHLPVESDMTYDLKLESIFTNYGGGYIDEAIKNGEISLDEEFEGKTLLHRLVENFSKEYPSFSFIGGTYKGPPENAPIDDLLNSMQYFIDKGFDINKPDSHGKNLLSNVIRRGPAEVVALLFQNGANVQPEFINAGNDYAGIFPKLGPDYGGKWNEKILPLFPEELLTELLNREVDGFFSVTDSQYIKLLLEGGAYPFDAFTRNDKQIQNNISGNIVFVQGEKKSYSYLKWATENYDKIRQWKEKQQVTFKLNRGEFAEIKDYVSRHPDSLQYITNVKLKTFLAGSEGLSVKEIVDRIAQGVKEKELIELISGNEAEYADFFTVEQKQYMLDAGLSTGLISFLEEHTRQVKNIKEERVMLAMLKQEEEQKASARVAAERQAQIDAQRRREREKQNENRELFGKFLAIGAGAVIANSAPLDGAKKAEFLTNYSTDVLTNNKSMSNTQQWANATGNQSAQTGSSGGVSNEEVRNKQISSSCRQQSNRYDDGDGQTTSHCRTAIYNKCVADGLCSLYPSKCGTLRSRVTTSCNMMSQMGFNGCPACN